ncbi:hypothetical protein RF11_09147 [Thelohanellus kitauei]|uniref:Uncharacterized protein n=1 Tax=Thelohanellus kitauei TaxID=669202 RepID=A0A0C2JP70_THEKT|nr:hypothetical protein RF11_09147 [Thelohanellus kitauei]
MFSYLAIRNRTPSDSRRLEKFCSRHFYKFYLKSFLSNRGHGGDVQVADSLLYKQKYGVGCILTNQDLWIVGGIDDNGPLFIELTVIQNMDAAKEISRRNIAP